MPLPLIPLPTTTIDVGDQRVTMRSLSRGEVLRIAELPEDPREVEAFIVSCAFDVPTEEAKAWLSASHPDVVNRTLVALMEWSGMSAPTEEGEAAPEDPSRGSTEEQGSGEPSSAP